MPMPIINSTGKTKYKGVARVPQLIQMEDLECGAVCLRMVLGYYGKWVSAEDIRQATGVSRNGSRAGRMVLAARGSGLEAEGYRIESIDQLADNAYYPCILFLKYHHFVVLKGIVRGTAYIADPASGSYKISLEELSAIYGGICILLKPGEDFVRDGERSSFLSLMGGEVKNRNSVIVFLITLTLLIAAINYFRPIMDMVFLDKVIKTNSNKWDGFFYNSLALICVLRLLCVYIQSTYHVSLQKKLALTGTTNYMWHLLNLPASFFTQRSSGDLLRRRDYNEKMSFDLVSSIAPFFLDVVLMFFYLVVMYRYSYILCAAGGVSIMLNIIVGAILIKRKMDSERVIERGEGLFSVLTVAGLGMMHTIKSCGAEAGFFERWAGVLTNIYNKKNDSESANAFLTKLPDLVNLICFAVIFVGGIYLISMDQMTVGGLLACVGYFSYMSEPAKKMATSTAALTEMASRAERVRDVMDYEREESKESSDLDESVSHERLKGQVDIENVTFGYSKYDEPVISDLTIHIKPGEFVAIMGASGCGKSTIAKLITGLYEPWDGTVLFDGKKREDIDGAIFTDCVAMVDQEICLFNDSLANNISMWDPTIEYYDVLLASLDAALHEEILLRPGGYDYRLSCGGTNFSGGQRQRIEIASALAHDPTVIIFDEATASLDYETESRVMNAIKDRGNTCILIAHRLSAIKYCDRIVMLDKGRILESGTHDELMAKHGRYYEMVNSEIIV